MQILQVYFSTSPFSDTLTFFWLPGLLGGDHATPKLKKLHLAGRVIVM